MDSTFCPEIQARKIYWILFSQTERESEKHERKIKEVRQERKE